MHDGETGRHTTLGLALVEQCQVGIRRYLDALAGGVRHHVEEARMHQRLTEALQVQLLQLGEIVNQALERIEGHKRWRPVRRSCLNSIGHIWQRRWHWPTGSTCK